MSSGYPHEGRLARGRYFLSQLGTTYIVLKFSALLVNKVDFDFGTFLYSVIIILFLYVWICESIRRLHDLDRPGIHLWLLVIPVYNIYLAIIMLLAKGTNGPNRFGENPLKNIADEPIQNMPGTPPENNMELQTFQSSFDESESLPQEKTIAPPNIEDNAAKLDINHASEEELAELPGVGPILAKKAISLRQKNEGFKSVDEFIEALGLRSNYADRIKLIVFAGPVAKFDNPILTSRVVDY